MNIEFNGKIWFWRGPAPWYFVTVPAEQSSDLKTIASIVTYGWGVIPVHARIGNTKFTTSLFPKDDRYIVPIKASVRQSENLEESDEVTLRPAEGRVETISPPGKLIHLDSTLADVTWSLPI